MIKAIAFLSLLLLGGACVHHPVKVETIQSGTLATMRAEEEIRSLHDPAFLTAKEATNLMRPDEKVLGFAAGEIAVAISLRVLDDHEIVNLKLGESSSAVAATW